MKKVFAILCVLILPLSVHAVTRISSSQSPGSLSNGLVGHWTMDGRNTNWVTQQVLDVSGNANNGQMQGRMATSSAPTEGKIGQALKFDGVNDYVAVGEDLGFAGDVEVSISSWLYLTGANSGNFPAIVDFQSQTGNCTGLYFTIKDNKPSIDFGGNRWRATSALAQGRWYHVVVTKSPGAISATSKIYVNGEEAAGAVENGDCTPNVATPGAGGLVIGRLTHTAEYVSGAFDDIRIYSRALSATEITKLYKQGGGAKASATQSPGGLASGLVGHWTMDGRNTNWVTQQVLDASGNGNSGQMQGGIATSSAPTEGKIGQALKFDGVDDYVTMGSVPTFTGNVVSESVWFNRKSNTADYECLVSIGKDSSTYGAFSICSMADGKIRAHAQENYLTSILSDGVVSNNVWHQAVMVSNGTNYYLYIDGVLQTAIGTTGTPGANFFRIGRSVDAAQYFDGSLDDVRIYDRALSPAEITQLYKQGGGTKTSVSTSPGKTGTGLVGHWTFDGKRVNWASGVVADSSSSGNNGVMTSLSTSTAPTEGKLGQALKFDGVNDYIQLTSNFVNTSQPYTVAGWINHTSTTRMMWLSKGDHGTDNFIDFEVNVHEGGANTFGMRSFFTGVGSSLEVVYASGVQPNRWQHVAMVRHTTAPNNFSIYINGVSMATSSASQAGPVAANPTTLVRIGARDVSGAVNLPFSGSMDDVRVYDRALTATEIQTLYRLR